MCEYATVRYAHGSMLSEKGEIQRYVAESAAEIQACQGGIAFDVSVLGDGLQPPEDMEAVARSVLDLLIERT